MFPSSLKPCNFIRTVFLHVKDVGAFFEKIVFCFLDYCCTWNEKLFLHYPQHVFNICPCLSISQFALCCSILQWTRKFKCTLNCYPTTFFGTNSKKMRSGHTNCHYTAARISHFPVQSFESKLDTAAFFFAFRIHLPKHVRRLPVHVCCIADPHSNCLMSYVLCMYFVRDLTG